MSDAIIVPAGPVTQVRHPWRATARTVVQAALALSVAAPAIYAAATQHDPAAATGLAAGALAVTGAFARVMALPAVEEFIHDYIPFLAASPGDVVEHVVPVPPAPAAGDDVTGR